jgi:hypothetical protein
MSITYPPELLPRPLPDEDVEIIVCDSLGRVAQVLTPTQKAFSSLLNRARLNEADGT